MNAKTISIVCNSFVLNINPFLSYRKAEAFLLSRLAAQKQCEQQHERDENLAPFSLIEIKKLVCVLSLVRRSQRLSPDGATSEGDNFQIKISHAYSGFHGGLVYNIESLRALHLHNNKLISVREGRTNRRANVMDSLSPLISNFLI